MVKELPKIRLPYVAQYDGIIKAVPSVVVFPSSDKAEGNVKEVRISIKRESEQPSVEMIPKLAHADPFSIDEVIRKSHNETCMLKLAYAIRF